MTPEVRRIREGLVIWQLYVDRVKVDCTSTLLRASDGWVVFDPVDIPMDALSPVLDGESVSRIVLTSENHQRDSVALARLWDCPILAPAEARPELVADQWYAAGDVLPDGSRVIPLPGVALGESALLCGDVLVVGDALIHLKEFDILPDKYCLDPARLRCSLAALLDEDFSTLCFAHGLPLEEQPRERLRALLTSASAP
ncbi:metallo-beta-lactamase superfamily protein [Terrimicrobium sacchariphilum]|uniref:Metallo-beta-lactamase superfamily protein n=1 Tax=Terrimicrobium sacchariphilum TaxID=690879 RepID=A0A146G762_TERSA|nr:hypothetical protein [Terrimicrobium sacchariphilum]GAT32754.1 metallo-beta-lactamase superfamily protein [Terrimicrobium sacchariphilum]